METERRKTDDGLNANHSVFLVQGFVNEFGCAAGKGRFVSTEFVDVIVGPVMGYVAQAGGPVAPLTVLARFVARGR